MSLSFILDEDYLAFFILYKKTFNESKELEDIKTKLYSDNNLGYKKILGKEFLDSSVYLNNSNIKELVYEFISTDKFKDLYKLYSNESEEVVAIKILKDIIKIDDNELTKVKDSLWYRYMDGYRTLLSINSFNTSVFLLDKDVRKLINSFKDSNEYKKLYNETKIYLDNIKKYWNDNKEIINNYLKRILKMDFKKEATVYITHPNTCEGYSFDNDKIVWGHYKGINNPNYNLVYLTHEWIHCLIPFTESDSEIDCYIKHSIIELVADYELYSMIEGRSTLKEGHSYLEEYKKFLYPYWLKYIGLDDNGIKERLEKDSISEFNDTGNDNISNMNIDEFIKYCSNKYLEIVDRKKIK